MSTLSSSSTLAEVNAAYDDNASYAEDNSPAKARAFITACRILLRRMTSVVEHAGQKVERDPAQIQEQLEEARQWLASHDTTSASSGAGAVRHYDFQDLRG